MEQLDLPSAVKCPRAAVRGLVATSTTTSTQRPARLHLRCWTTLAMLAHALLAVVTTKRTRHPTDAPA